MLEIQKYLKDKNVEDLTKEFGIIVRKHDSLPLMILNYSQLDSPKTAAIVRECRGLVLHSENHSLVARSFSRFFNWGEVQDEQSLFDFSDFVVQSKEDGSLVVLYYFNGEWHANTRGSFADDLMQHQTFSWKEGFCRALKIKSLRDLSSVLDTEVTYVCEFCSPWNKVVRRYTEPVMYLLTAFRGLTEVSNAEADVLAGSCFLRPVLYEFHSIEEIQKFLQEQESKDPTFEGVVIKDKNGNRWKVKSATYLGFHRLKGEGNNLFNPKYLLPFILSGEDDELLTYFDEVRGTYFEYKSKVSGAYSHLLETWADHKDIAQQKDFALAVQGEKFSSILFSLRKKYGSEQKSSHVRDEWRNSEAAILKHVFNK